VRFSSCLCLVSLGVAVAGCASPDMPRPPQDVALDLMPAATQCDAFQHGVAIAHTDAAKGSITLPMRDGSTDIVCSAAGYKEKRVSIVANQGKYAFYLADFGGANVGMYPPRLAIVLDPTDKPGSPG